MTNNTVTEIRSFRNVYVYPTCFDIEVMRHASGRFTAKILVGNTRQGTLHFSKQGKLLQDREQQKLLNEDTELHDVALPWLKGYIACWRTERVMP